MAGRFRGKIVLVTGGSRGIGRVIALAMAREGAGVAISYYRRKTAAREVVAEIEGLGVDALAVKANLAEPEKIDGLFDAIDERFGRLDIFVSNAASGVAKKALELTDRHFDWTMNVNARAFLLCAQRAVPLMKGGGRMVAISSLGSRIVMPVYAAVGVSKAALEALTRYLAVELAPKGISVNAIAAGGVESDALKLYTADPNLPKPLWRNTPAGRMVQPEDIAELAVFLAGDGADMIRGQTIVLDGGLSLTHLQSREGEPREGESRG